MSQHSHVFNRELFIKEPKSLNSKFLRQTVVLLAYALISSLQNLLYTLLPVSMMQLDGLPSLPALLTCWA